MHPFDKEKLGWEDYRGLPIWEDPGLQPGRFRVECPLRLRPEGEETTEAVGTELVTV